MKISKKIFALFLFNIVLIATNINSLNVNAISDSDPAANHDSSTPILDITNGNDNPTNTNKIEDSEITVEDVQEDSEITVEDVQNDLDVDFTVAENILDALTFQIKIAIEWDDLKVEKDLDLYNSTDKALGKPGDILIAMVDLDNFDINAIKLGSITTHAAMVDSDPKKLLEVMPSGVQNVENDWKTRYKKTLVLRPQADEETIKSAIEYGHTQINIPYNYILLNKTRTDKFYCSQFVWRCYYNSGLDLDRNSGNAVFPYDLISDKTTIVYKQGD